MERIKAAFLSTDTEYTSAVAACMRSMGIPADFTLLREYSDIKDNEKYDIYIVDFEAGQTLYDHTEEHHISDDANTLFLTGDTKDRGQESYIYKYSSLASIADMIVATARKWRNEDVSSSDMRSCSIYMVYSVAGGSGCSSIAMGLARDFASSGDQRVLYISIGDIHGERIFFEQKAEGNIKEFIYEYLYGTGCLYEKRSSYFNKDLHGVMAFNTSSYRNRIGEMTGGEASGMIRNLADGTLFDKIIIDAGQVRNEISAQIKEMADRIVVVKGSKDTLLSDELINEDKKSFGEKMIAVENFMPSLDRGLDDFFDDRQEDHDIGNENVISEKPQKEKICEMIHIENDEKAFTITDGIVDIDISGAFGKGIRQLVCAIASGFCL